MDEVDTNDQAKNALEKRQNSIANEKVQYESSLF